MINGKTRIYGLIGNPVEHTISPMIHNNLSSILGHNLVYVPFHVEAGTLQKAIEGAYALNIVGINVTVPYKSDVIGMLKDIEPLAKQIGAVNTLARVEGGYKGYNTDMPGLYRAMQSDGVHIENASVLILGAGGVARAVTMLMASKSAREIIICNRTLEKASEIAKEVNAYIGNELVKVLPLSDYKKLQNKKYLTIQATSVGLHPNDEEVIIDVPDFYSYVEVGYDMICNPADTKFMQMVRQAGGQAYNGLKMLLYQGIIAYEIWNETIVAEEQAIQIYQLMKSEMGL